MLLGILYCNLSPQNEWEKPTWSDFTDEELGIPPWNEEDVE